MFSLISSITQQQPTKQSLIKKPSIKKLSHPPSASLLYLLVNKEVEQQFSGRG
jgi:hypothetical protein